MIFQGNLTNSVDGKSDETVYKKVAVVENFYNIIYNVHVEMDGRSGKHAGQKRTYRAVSSLIQSDDYESIFLRLRFERMRERVEDEDEDVHRKKKEIETKEKRKIR